MARKKPVHRVEMMETEMDDHLGYQKSKRSDNEDSCNGYKHKQGNSSYGSMQIEVPQDCKSGFAPQIVKKLFYTDGFPVCTLTSAYLFCMKIS